MANSSAYDTFKSTIYLYKNQNEYIYYIYDNIYNRLISIEFDINKIKDDVYFEKLITLFFSKLANISYNKHMCAINSYILYTNHINISSCSCYRCAKLGYYKCCGYWIKIIDAETIKNLLNNIAIETKIKDIRLLFDITYFYLSDIKDDIDKNRYIRYITNVLQRDIYDTTPTFVINRIIKFDKPKLSDTIMRIVSILTKKHCVKNKLLDRRIRLLSRDRNKE